MAAECARNAHQTITEQPIIEIAAALAGGGRKRVALHALGQWSGLSRVAGGREAVPVLPVVVQQVAQLYNRLLIALTVFPSGQYIRGVIRIAESHTLLAFPFVLGEGFSKRPASLRNGGLATLRGKARA